MISNIFLMNYGFWSGMYALSNLFLQVSNWTTLMVFANSRRIIDICIPGSEGPKWFSHQRDESSIKITLPPNIRNASRWIGVAFCCVFVSTLTDVDACGEEEIIYKAVIHGVNSHEINDTVFQFGRKYRRPRIVKNHLWLRYLSRNELYPLFLDEKCGATENLFSTNFEDQECDEIFESSIHCDECYKVKCGVQLVYNKALEEMEQIKEQCSSSTSSNFHDHGLTSEASGCIKRKTKYLSGEGGRTE